MDFKSMDVMSKMLNDKQTEIISDYVEINSFYEHCFKDTSIIEYDEDLKVQFIYLEDENNTMKFTFQEDGIYTIINRTEYFERY